MTTDNSSSNQTNNKSKKKKKGKKQLQPEISATILMKQGGPPEISATTEQYTHQHIHHHFHHIVNKQPPSNNNDRSFKLNAANFKHIASGAAAALDDAFNNHQNHCSNPNHTHAPQHKKNKPPTKDKSTNKANDIWHTSDVEEKERIREFWMKLGEDDRKSLVKLEKEAVLKKMKEQQKHTCSCNVCGRKRLVIEEELEILYDAYYEELENFANDKSKGPHPHSHLLGPSKPDRLYHDIQRRKPNTTHTTPYVSEIISDDDFGDGSDSDSEDDDDDMYEFGSSLTVKGGILTIADDFLKNDGRKFLDLMEQLAERKIRQIEETSTTRSYSDDEDDEYEDEEECMTEEQRMEEGRKMFQIFAAKMFEQRVLTAYREKVAKDRQDQLLKEEEEERKREAEKEEQRIRQKEEKKAKKRMAKQAKDDERLAKEADKRAIEEERLRVENEKKEAERKKIEEENLRLEKIRAEKQAIADEKARVAEKIRADKEEKKRKAAEKKAKKLERERLERERVENERLEKLRQKKEKAEEKERERLENERLLLLEKERLEAAEKKTHIQITKSPGLTIKKVIATTSNLSIDPPPGYVFSTLPQQQAQQVLAFANHPPPQVPQQSPPFGLFGRNPAMVDSAILNVTQPGYINPVSPVGYAAAPGFFPTTPTTYATPQQQWTKEYTQAALQEIQTQQAALALQKQQLESVMFPPSTPEFQMVEPSLNTKVFGDVFGNFGGGEIGGVGKIGEERDFAYNGVNGSKKIW